MPLRTEVISCATSSLASSSDSHTRFCVKPHATPAACSGKPPIGRDSAANRSSGDAAIPRWSCILTL